MSKKEVVKHEEIYIHIRKKTAYAILFIVGMVVQLLCLISICWTLSGLTDFPKIIVAANTVAVSIGTVSTSILMGGMLDYLVGEE